MRKDLIIIVKMSIMEGSLCKWTNIIKGWQYRWFVLDDNSGLLSYYISKEKMVRGAQRGCVRLKDAIIGIDDEDDSTFTITVDKKTFYFQARDTEERDKWIHVLEDTILRHTCSFQTVEAYSKNKTKSMGQHHTAETEANYSKKACIAFDYGEIVEIPEKLGRLRVEWKIPDFLSLREEIQRAVFSPTFNFLQAGYNLGILPFSDKDSKTRCEIRLFLGTSKKPDTCTVSIRQVDGTVDKSCSFSGLASFTRDVLLKKQFMWLSSGALTVTLQIQSTETSEAKPAEKEPEVELLWDSKNVKAKEIEPICLSDSDSEDDPETSDRTHDSRETRLRLADLLGLCLVSKGTQTEDLLSLDEENTEHEQLETKSISKLTKHLGELLLEDPDHDVTIKVKNRPFKAHKAVLRARSPVFASMFRHDMEENASGAVSIDDCEPGVFGQFLKHVYTGAFEIDSVKSAIALHYAADKYDFQDLKEACVRYLSESLSNTTVCDVIKLATVHGEKALLQRASLFFERNLEKILTTVEWQIFLEGNTTIANELLIQAVMKRSERSEQKKISVSLECPSCSVKRT